jgi:hypothetical protein
LVVFRRLIERVMIGGRSLIEVGESDEILAQNKLEIELSTSSSTSYLALRLIMTLIDGRSAAKNKTKVRQLENVLTARLRAKALSIVALLHCSSL